VRARGNERDKRPQPAKDALELLSLPDKENGKKVRNGFFLSGTRLSPISRRRTRRSWRRT
jgi:hypothetical protein